MSATVTPLPGAARKPVMQDTERDRINVEMAHILHRIALKAGLPSTFEQALAIARMPVREARE